MKSQSEISEQNPDLIMKPDELTNKYSQEVAGFFDMEPLDGVKCIVYDSMDDLKKAFTDYIAERYKDLGKSEQPPQPPTYLKGYNPGGPKWKEVWMAKWGTPDEHGHTMSRERFNQRLKHELTHVYVHSLAKNTRSDRDDYVPDWLNEGVCYFLANQKAEEPEHITIDKIRELDKTFDSSKFSVGSKMVSLIVEQFGKEKLIELISMPKHEQILTELKRMFDWLK